MRAQWEAQRLNALLVAATGAGKTQMFLRLLMDELPVPAAGRGLILAHRKELIDQPLQRIGDMDAGWLNAAALAPRVGVVQASREDYNRQLTIATVQSLNPRRLEKLLSHGAITHLVIDEAHHGVASSYTRIIEALREANPALRHLGVTATPIRADGDGLAAIYDDVAARITIADLVRQGWLVKPRWLAIATGISLRGVKTSGGDYVASQLAERFDTPGGRAVIVATYIVHASQRRAIAFTASVAGAHDLAAAFNDPSILDSTALLNAVRKAWHDLHKADCPDAQAVVDEWVARGVTAAAIDGSTPKDERDRVLGDFRAGRVQIVCNCQVLTEGFDAPGTSCVLMCRPTKSDGLYIQCMGRGLRPANGKAKPDEDCLILDFLPEDVRNIVMAGDVLGVPKEQADAVRAMLEEEGDEEAQQVGFTFDGDTFNFSNDAMEIVARQLDYLNQSGLAWFPPTGVRKAGELLTVGLGVGSDGYERILAVRDGILYGIHRPQAAQGERAQPWRAKLIECSDAYAKAEEIAGRWATQTLASKGARWRTQPLSEGQARYLSRLAKGRLTTTQVAALTRGEAAQWITHLQAVEVMAKIGRVEVAG